MLCTLKQAGNYMEGLLPWAGIDNWLGGQLQLGHQLCLQTVHKCMMVSHLKKFQPVPVTITTSSCRQGRILLTGMQVSNQLPRASEYLTSVEGLQTCCQTGKPRHECWVVRQALVEGMQCTGSKRDHVAQNSLPRPKSLGTES